MQRPPKRPPPSSTTTYEYNYTNDDGHFQTYSPSLSFQEESDTSRRVKFRLSNHSPDHYVYPSSSYSQQPIYSAESIQQSYWKDDHVPKTYDGTTLSQPSYSRGQPQDIPYDQSYQQDSHTYQQPDQSGSQDQQYDEYSQREYPHEHNQYPQTDHTYSETHFYQAQPLSDPPGESPQIEAYDLPHRTAKRSEISTTQVVDPEVFLNQEGGVASDRNISGMLDRWNGEDDNAQQQDGQGKEVGDREIMDSKEGGGKRKSPKVLVVHAPYYDDLAAAWYDPVKRKIEVLEDTKDTLGWDLAMLVIEQVQPDQIVMSSRTAQSLTDKIAVWDEENPLERSESDVASSRLSILSYKQCKHSAAIATLACVRLPNQSSIVQSTRPLASSASTNTTSDQPVANYGYENNDEQEYRLGLTKLGCWVNIDAPLAVVATGILINQVKQSAMAEDTNSEAVGRHYFELNSLESMELEQHLQINKDALTSLAIFDVEAHAYMHARNHKQALSVFGLLDTCVTPLGKKLFHTWHLRPLANKSQIEARHEAISVFTANHNSPITDTLIKLLRKIKNIPYILHKMRNGTAKFMDWRHLIESFEAIVEVRTNLIGLPWPKPVEVIRKARGNISLEIETLRATVNQCIDWDTSRAQSRMAVKVGVSVELDEMKEVYAKLDGFLNEVARMIHGEIPPGTARDFNVIYLPQIGFHAVIHTEEESSPPMISDWEARFSTTDKHYYKNQHMRDLDAHYGDIYVAMTNLEIDIVQDLTEKLQVREPTILAAVDVISELDCLLALAKAVHQFDLRRPHMTNDNSLKIKGGRHILYDQVCHTYVPNDIILAGGKYGDNHNMMIVTGANGSGKSAYGKQVALIVFMAQMGSFVPAEQAEIGICDKIFTRLQTKESSSKHASAFMIDLGQVSQALRGATEKSLIILDEFGKGTITWDGAGLLAGVIDYLQAGPCPKTVVLTHFHELITQRFIKEDSGVLFAHMKTIMGVANELHFLFKLAPGSSHTSYAAECALQHNIPKEIVDRAIFVTECVSKFELHKIQNTHITPTEEAELKANEVLAARFLGWAIDPDIENVRMKVEDMLEETDVSLFATDATTDNRVGNGNDKGAEETARLEDRERRDDQEVDELVSDNDMAYSDETD
ncbi:hypothetical protein V865_004517 [Kwoniella europaea PYCC6329]|uniref:DNA mismatch repair proteins mutS family domain-containing protein n=1 Tax=Kwoniella europaea PYCC6329 TaxID=1423913 RepID=A0AAX4KL39_9TREE